MLSKRVVVCAAVRFPDGVMLVGPRHYDKVMLDQFQRHYQGVAAVPSEAEGECGFLDQAGVFLDRTTAFGIAKVAGQVLDSGYPAGPRLFSEDLYGEYRAEVAC